MHQVIFSSPACGGAKENIAAYSSLKYRFCANNFRLGGLPVWPHEQQFSDARPFCCAVWHSNVTGRPVAPLWKKESGVDKLWKMVSMSFLFYTKIFYNACIFYGKNYNQNYFFKISVISLFFLKSHLQAKLIFNRELLRQKLSYS